LTAPNAVDFQGPILSRIGPFFWAKKEPEEGKASTRGIRVANDKKTKGLDQASHGENGYSIQ